MSILCSSWNTSSGPWSARCGPGAGGSWLSRHPGLSMYIRIEWPDLQFSSKTVMSAVAKHLEDHEVVASEEYVYAYQNEVAEGMAFGYTDWAGNSETRRSKTAVLEKLGNHCIESVSCSQTGIALSSGEAEFHAVQQAAAGASQTAYLNKVETASASDGAKWQHGSDREFVTIRCRQTEASRSRRALDSVAAQKSRNRRQSCRRLNEVR